MQPSIHQDTIVVIGNLITKAVADKTNMPQSFQNDLVITNDGVYNFEKVISMTINNFGTTDVQINKYNILRGESVEYVKPDGSYCDIELNVKFIGLFVANPKYTENLTITYKKIK